MRILPYGLVFLVSCSMLGQTPVPVSTTKDATLAPPVATSPMVPPKAAPAELPPNTPIATLQGVCDGVAVNNAKTKSKTVAKAAAAKSKTCKTVITRAEMDALLDILVPGASLETRRTFALNYIRILAASAVAQSKRLENNPVVAKEMATRMQFTGMQVMAAGLYQRVETLAADVKDEEISSYYNGHPESFVQGEVARIVIMKTNAGGLPLDLAPLKTKAEELRARAVKGEDFAALQKEAAAVNSTTPPTWDKVALVRRAVMPPSEGVVFDLKPGEVTQVVEGPSALEILKLVSLKPIQLDAVRKDIKNALTNGHLQLIMADATKDVTADFNLSYLSLQSKPLLFLTPTLQKVGDGQHAGGPPAPAAMPRRATGPGSGQRMEQAQQAQKQ